MVTPQRAGLSRCGDCWDRALVGHQAEGAGREHGVEGAEGVMGNDYVKLSAFGLHISLLGFTTC
jgi:hypothetical protein